MELLKEIKDREDLPAEIIVSLGICYSNIGDKTESIYNFKRLMNYNPTYYSDLYMKTIISLELIGILINNKDENNMALDFCERLMSA